MEKKRTLQSKLKGAEIMLNLKDNALVDINKKNVFIQYLYSSSEMA